MRSDCQRLDNVSHVRCAEAISCICRNPKGEMGQRSQSDRQVADLAIPLGMAAKCPICQNSVTRSDATFPFCSGRCRSADLGTWLDGTYRIADPSPMDVMSYGSSAMATLESVERSDEDAQ